MSPTNPERANWSAESSRSYGRIDALVNTVGGYTGGTALWEVAPDALDRMLALNLRSGYALARAAVPAMLKQKQGRSSTSRRRRASLRRAVPPFTPRQRPRRWR